MDRDFNEEELKSFDGKNGNPAYIAYNGIVYDVTDSPLWKNGLHLRRHQAGTDLTSVLKDAPHGQEVFEHIPKIGFFITSLEKEKNGKNSDKSSTIIRFRQWNKTFHPHPISVHFPIALHYFSAFFNMMFLFDPKSEYDFATYSSFVAATVMGGIALLAGIFSWWVKYALERSRVFMIKLVGALMTLGLGLIPIMLKIENPFVAYSHDIDGYIYHFIIFFTALSVSIVGYYGGKITWGGK